MALQTVFGVEISSVSCGFLGFVVIRLICVNNSQEPPVKFITTPEISCHMDQIILWPVDGDKHCRCLGDRVRAPGLPITAGGAVKVKEFYSERTMFLPA